MRSNSKKGALDRQARFPRVTLRFSTTLNPASISFIYLYTESQPGKCIRGIELERH